MLTREVILGADDIKREKVDLTEYGWPGYVYVQGMTGKQRGRFEADLNSTKGKNQQENWIRFRAKMLVYCVVSDAGDRLFRESDVDALNEKSAAPLDCLFAVAQRLSGYRKEDVEEITKNSQDDQSEDSSID
jgi:hypothetical protein